MKNHFQEERDTLRVLTAEFAKAHPGLARRLSGPGSDPDVERLLEGVAFLTAMLRQKLDDDFPEIIHELVQLIFPHYLRPIPSATIIRFMSKPKAKLRESRTVPAGTLLASVPVEGTTCFFRTCYDAEIHPLNVWEAILEEPSVGPPSIRLIMELEELNLSDWHPEKLRFFLFAEDYGQAATIYFLLRYYLKQIRLRRAENLMTMESDEDYHILSKDHLKPVGFSQKAQDKEELIPYPPHGFPGYRILQEYFILPEKFLFFDLIGWETWQERGKGSRFEIRFDLDFRKGGRRDLSFPLPRIRPENFVLSATPAINIFPHDADPIRMDHRRTEYLIRPSGADPAHYQVYSVDEVSGLVHGTMERRTYSPFEIFNSEIESEPVFRVNIRKSSIHSEYDAFLSVAYSQKTRPATEAISLNLRCSNGFLAEYLQVGDISKHTDTSPEFAAFENIHRVTPNVLPPLGKGNLLWRFLSHLALNHLSLEEPENLRALLDLYIFEDTREPEYVIMRNREKIKGIQDVKTQGADQLVNGIMMRGREIRLEARADAFESEGDLYLFGCVLDHFMGGYASINTFTRFILKETLKGDIFPWPSRLGDRPLI